MMFRLPILSERIQLWDLKTTQDDLGGYIEKWGQHTTCWAHVQWLTPRISRSSGQKSTDDLAPHALVGRYKFVLRSQPFPRPLRVVWRTKLFGLASDIVDLNAHFSFFIGHDLHQQSCTDPINPFFETKIR